MNTIKKAIVGTAAATAMAVSATPAMAKDGHRDGISAGEVIAGAVVLGGLAAILSSGKKDRYNDNYEYRGDRHSRHYDNRRYNHRNYSRLNSRTAVDRCIRQAEHQATRYYGWADVTEIRDVDRTRYGYEVKGRIVVKDQYRGRYNNSRYNRYNRYRQASYDKGKFTCHIEGRGRTRVNFKGLDGSRRY